MVFIIDNYRLPVKRILISRDLNRGGCYYRIYLTDSTNQFCSFLKQKINYVVVNLFKFS